MEIVTIPERTKRFSKRLLRFFSQQHQQTTATRILHAQLIRSGTSIGANVLEAQYAASRRQFFQYYRIALRSSRETEYWLDLLRSIYPTDNATLQDLAEEARQISNILYVSLLKSRNLT